MDGVLDRDQTPVVPVDRYRADLNPDVALVFPEHPEGVHSVGSRLLHHGKEDLPVAGMDRPFNEAGVAHVLLACIPGQVLPGWADILDSRWQFRCTDITVMRPLHERPEPLLALPEPLVPVNPDKEVGEQVADDREQGDVIP